MVSPLEICWSRLCSIDTIKLAFELQKFVGRAVQLTSSTPRGLVMGECDSFWLDDYYRFLLNAIPAYVQSFITFWLRFPGKQPLLYPDPELHHSDAFPSDTICIYTSRPRSTLYSDRSISNFEIFDTTLSLG